jgi:SPP1 gp7 family putative phage head morphogenesis protein
VDISTMLGGSDVHDTVGAFISRNVSLIRSVSDDTRTKISDIVLRNYQARAPLQQVSKEMADAVGLSRKRSLRIAVHQSANLYGRLDQARQQQAGITQFKYVHGHPAHPRSWHSARNGRVYNWDTFEEVGGSDVIAPGDRPSEPPGCTCRTQAWIDLS